MAELWQAYGSWVVYGLFFLLFLWLHGFMHGHGGHGAQGGHGEHPQSRPANAASSSDPSGGGTHDHDASDQKPHKHSHGCC